MGPTSADHVMCLTCHRSHASAFPDIGRWDFTVEFIAESHPMDTTLYTATPEDIANKYYNYAAGFDPDQRSLCNKCHYKDQFDGPIH